MPNFARFKWLPKAAASGALVLGSVGLVGLTSATAQGGGGCQLDGTATFTPNGPGTMASFGYSLTGSLSGCQSSPNMSGAPTSGTVGVGQVLTESVTITTSTGTVQGTAQYAEPLASGSGNIPVNSCPAGATAGEAFVQWPDGTYTVSTYTTQSEAAGVELQGTVVASENLALVAGSESPAGTAPATYAISSNNASFPARDGEVGLVTFTVSDPTQCNTAGGLTSAQVQGFIGIGSS